MSNKLELMRIMILGCGSICYQSLGSIPSYAECDLIISVYGPSYAQGNKDTMQHNIV